MRVLLATPRKAGRRPGLEGAGAIIATAALCLCGGVYAQDTAPESAAGEPVLSFGWELPLSATVEETAVREGATTVVRYRIEALPDDDGDIIVQQNNMQLLQFNGEDPELALGILHGPVLAMASNAPAMRIDRDGHFVDVVDLGATIDRMVQLLVQDLTALEPNLVRDMIAAARTPAVMQLTVDATRSRWNNWVGHWIGMPLRSKSWSYDEPVNELEGMTTLRSSALVEQIPVVESGHLRVRLTTVWEGTQGDAGEQGEPRALATDRAPPPDHLSMEISNTVDATIDPDSLRPLLVLTKTQTTMRVGGQEQVDTQRHEYRFRWAVSTAPETSD